RGEPAPGWDRPATSGRYHLGSDCGWPAVRSDPRRRQAPQRRRACHPAALDDGGLVQAGPRRLARRVGGCAAHGAWDPPAISDLEALVCSAARAPAHVGDGAVDLGEQHTVNATLALEGFN